MTITSASPSQRKLISRSFYIIHGLTIIFGFGFALCGYFIQSTEEEYLSQFNLVSNSKKLFQIFYFTAVVIFIAALVGLIAVVKTNKPGFWALYCTLMGTMVLVELILGGSALSKAIYDEVNIGVELKIKMGDYSQITDKSDRKKIEDNKLWDDIHGKYKCCGVNNYTDWQDVQYGRTSLKVPISCCLPNKQDDQYCGQNLLPFHEKASELIYPEGCISKLLDHVDFQHWIGGIFSLCNAVFQFFVVVLTSYLLIIKRL